MKRVKFAGLILIFGILFSNLVFCQKQVYHSIQEALDSNLTNLQNHIGHFDNIFIISNLDDSIMLPSKIFRVIGNINAKFLKKGDLNYLVEITIPTQLDDFQIEITNYKIIRLSKKKIKLSNLSNGQTCQIE